MVQNEMVVIDFNELMWADIVDYYFDNVHWQGEERSKYNKPTDWLEDKYGAIVKLDDRVIVFNNTADRDWFILRWGT